MAGTSSVASSSWVGVAGFGRTWWSEVPFIDRKQMTLQAAARNESGRLGARKDLH
ncbi:hypothetical protein W823_08760 [Williamsia sp. D3]|nr:hypothetical protein W823_08760 [Williamsia sp. D3]